MPWESHEILFPIDSPLFEHDSQVSLVSAGERLGSVRQTSCQLSSTCHKFQFTLTSGINLDLRSSSSPKLHSFASALSTARLSFISRDIKLSAMSEMASPAQDGDDTIMKDVTMSKPMPEIDESVAPTKHLLPGDIEGESEDEAGDDAEDDAPGPPITPAELSAPRKKRKRSKKTTASRGPTALPKNRGHGFEGTIRFHCCDGGVCSCSCLC